MITDQPFDFNDYVRPACLAPGFTSKGWVPFEGGIMIASGMGKINNNDVTSELKIASIQMLKFSECRQHWKNTFTFPYTCRRPDYNNFD